jgi:hypothetical protein
MYLNFPLFMILLLPLMVSLLRLLKRPIEPWALIGL